MAAGWLFLMASLVTAPGCRKNPKELKDFNQVNLVANNDEYAATRIDPRFLNAWGMSFSPGGTIWVSVANTGLSEVWDKAGNIKLPAVTIPVQEIALQVAIHQGRLFNGPVVLSFLMETRPGLFLPAWMELFQAGTEAPAAVQAIDDSPSGAVYTGIELASDGALTFYMLPISARVKLMYMIHFGQK